MAHGNVRLAVVVPEQNVVSETFIGSHIEGLFHEPSVIWGSPKPLFSGDGESLLPKCWKTLARVLGFAFRVEPVRMQIAIGRRLPSAMYSRMLAGFLKRIGTEVVLAEYGPTGVVVLDACSASEIPVIVHFHGYDAYKRELLAEMRNSYQRLFHSAFRVVAVSNHMVDQLALLGCPPDRVILNPCGVDLNKFDGARPAEVGPLFLALGRFVEKKGPLLTLKAFAQVAKSEAAARLVMLGDGPLRQHCIELAKELAVDDKVDFSGTVSHQEAAAWMRKTRCFVQHSRRAKDGDSEGTPVALLEASSSGLPIVSTRHAGIPDAVVDGVGGFLVDEGDVDGMARHMLCLARDPALAGRMGTAGRRHIEAHYSLEKSLARLRQVLGEAAHGDA